MMISTQLLSRDVASSKETSSSASSPRGSQDQDAFDENQPLPSMGSALHGKGECKRCNFFAKGRCRNGFDCTFCHFPHNRRKLSRQEKREGKELDSDTSSCEVTPLLMSQKVPLEVAAGPPGLRPPPGLPAPASEATMGAPTLLPPTLPPTSAPCLGNMMPQWYLSSPSCHLPLLATGSPLLSTSSPFLSTDPPPTAAPTAAPAETAPVMWDNCAAMVGDSILPADAASVVQHREMSTQTASREISTQTDCEVVCNCCRQVVDVHGDLGKAA